MKKIIALLLIGSLGLLSAFSQQPPPQAQQPRPGKIFVQTPFGRIEVDAPPPEVTAPANPAPPAATPAPVQQPPAAPARTDAQPAPAAQAPQGDDAVPIELRFETPTDIYNVIRIILGVLNVNYIIDPAVKGTVNVVAANNLRRSDLLPILETILKINNATIIKNGNFYQIVPAASAARQPLEVQQQPPPTNPDDQMVLQIIRMRYVSASEMATLLNPYISEGANIVVQSTGNIILITERRSNLRKLLQIVDIFDTNAFQDERVRLYPVKNNLARDLVSDLTSVFSGYALSQNTSAIRFSAVERINSILAITTNATVFPEIEKWINRLDANTLGVGVRNFVYKVKNSKAADIQAVLAQLYGGQVQLSSIYNQPSPNPSPTMPPNTPMATPPPAPAAPAGAPSARLGDIRIIADIGNNALVIQATPQVYQDIERTIQELDVLKRQVLIDAQVYEVTLSDSLSFGLSAILQNRGTLANPQTTASFVGASPSLSAQTFAFIGRTRELVGFLNASENRSRVRTLSAPSVLVSDNMTADFQVGAEVPIPTSSAPVLSGGTNLFVQSIQFRPTGVLLRVKPQINDSGNVTLEIAQEVSQASANTTSAVVAPVIGKSSVSSTVVIQDGQTIALGGFIRENNDLARARLPLLGRIPGVGVLFGTTNKSAGRTELIILITPHVLRTHEDADLATDELKAKLREVQKLLN